MASVVVAGIVVAEVLVEMVRRRRVLTVVCIDPWQRTVRRRRVLTAVCPDPRSDTGEHVRGGIGLEFAEEYNELKSRRLTHLGIQEPPGGS